MEKLLFEKTIIMVFLAVGTFLDIKYKKIPIILPIIWGCLGFVWNIGIKRLDHEQWAGVIGSILIGCMLFIFSIWSQEAFGRGDAFIFIILGIYIDFYSNLLLLGTALFFSSFAAIYYLIIHKKGKKEKIPFIPYIYTAYALLCLTY